MPQKNNDSDNLARVYFELMDSFRGKYPNKTANLFVIYACYILFKLSKPHHNGLLVYDLIFTADLDIEPSVLKAIYNTYNRGAFEQSIEILSGCTSDGLVKIIEDYAIVNYERNFGYYAEHSTPVSIVSLAERILKIHRDENVADVCSGNGDFLCHALKKHPDVNYYGYEIDEVSIAVSKIRTDIRGHKLVIEPGDAIANLDRNKNIKFDKIFCNYPFGLRVFGDNQINIKYDHLARNNRYDWLFNTVICEHLAESGKAVSVVTTGSLWNMLDRSARKYFIDSGFIEAIISLPAGAFQPLTGIETAIIVFSKNNRSVRFIDATNFRSFISFKYSDNGDNLRLLRYEIDKIISLFSEDIEGKSFLVDYDEIKNKEYDLSLKAYYSDLPKYENGLKIGDVAEILRGAVVSSRNITNEPCSECVVRSSDIQSVIVPPELSYLKGDRIHPCVSLKPGDILVSRTLNPMKVAIFTDNNKNTVYPSGNFLIIRLQNEKIIDPYYLLSFLLSEEGQKALSFAATGTALKVLSAGSLGNISFPLMSIDEQLSVSERMRAALMEVSTYEFKLSQARDKIKGSFRRDFED